MLQDDASAVASILEDMSKVLDDLFSLSQEKRDCVVSRNIPRLESILLEEQDLMYRLSLLEERYFEIQKKNPFPAQEFSERLNSIKKKAFSLRTANQRNQELISHALSVVQRELEILLPDESYQREKKATSGPRVFDKKV